jgi:hypothetical protein
MFDQAMPKNTAAMSVVHKDGGVVHEMNDLKVSNVELVVPFIRAGLYVLIRTRLATDYVVPVAIALTAIGSFFWVYPTLLVSLE